MATAERQPERPAFRGKLLRELPIPAAGLLSDDEFGNAVLGEYNERVRMDFHDNPALHIFKVAEGYVQGSNPFACALLDMIVRPELRVASPPDLQVIHLTEERTDEPLDLRGCYKDAALALRTVGEPNGYLADKLSRQVGLQTPLPVVIFLSGLELVQDEQSPCGLSFRLTDEARFFTAPVLMEKSGHFQNVAVDPVTGLPRELGGDQRYYYGVQEGLTRIYVGRGWSLDTIWDELANSQTDGRVVLIDNSVPFDDVAEYVSILDQATDLIGS